MDATVDRSQSFGFLVVRVALGVLLLVTAGLKLLDPSPDAFSGLELLSSPRWRMAAIEAEALLGLWLLAGVYPRLLWMAALSCFALLASVGLYLGIEGQSSCGCFGAKLPVSPWYALGLDLAALASLLWWRPRPRQKTEVSYSATMRRVLATAGGSGVILAAIFGGLTWIYGSPYEALVRVRGEPIIVEPSVSQVGDGVAGEQRTFTIQLSNHGDKTVTIIGGNASCYCLSVGCLPIVIPTNESRKIVLQMNFRGRIGRFQHSFILHTDDERQPAITVRFAGSVIDVPSL